ncbi:MAG: hypothetical protein ABSF46_30115, partial [Terriglobia bacterium]
RQIQSPAGLHRSTPPLLYAHSSRFSSLWVGPGPSPLRMTGIDYFTRSYAVGYVLAPLRGSRIRRTLG